MTFLQFLLFIAENITIISDNEQTTSLSESDKLLLWNTRLAMDHIILDVFLAIYILFGLLGNVVIIYIYKWKMKKNFEDKFFILALAILDAVVCVTSSIIYLIFNIIPVRFSNDIACKLSWFITRTLSNTSGMLILVIGIQRYLKVCRPFGWQMTLYWQKLAILGLLIASIVMDIPLFFFYGVVTLKNEKERVTGYRCGSKLGSEDGNLDKYITYYFAGMFATACCVMAGITLLYALIGRKIYIQIKKKQKLVSQGIVSGSGPQSNAQTQEDESSFVDNKLEEQASSVSVKRKSQVVTKKKSPKSRIYAHRYSIMFMTISAVCAVTYIPSLVVNMVYQMDSSEFWNDMEVWRRSLCVFVFQAFLINHVSNPFIYGFFDGKFREHLYEIICK